MSLTIQAPHANMNAYEIGDDETRKNKVSDKGTIYAGDLQFAQTTGNAAGDKKQSARKQAMKLIRDAWDSDNKAVSQRDQIAQQKEEKLKEVRECNEELKQIRESKGGFGFSGAERLRTAGKISGLSERCADG